MIYYEAMKAIRKSKNLSQNRLSKETNISTQNISRWERGEVIPTITMCIKLADYYGITLDELVGRDPASKTQN